MDTNRKPLFANGWNQWQIFSLHYYNVGITLGVIAPAFASEAKSRSDVSEFTRTSRTSYIAAETHAHAHVRTNRITPFLKGETTWKWCDVTVDLNVTSELWVAASTCAKIV